MNIHQIKEIIREKYRITGILGKGGVAITYSAIDLNSNVALAIKVISLKQLEDWKQIELFQREAEVLKQLNYSGIPKYIDYFDRDTDKDKLFYIVQELAPGKSLQELVDSGWRISEDKAKNIAQQILKILTYLHSLDPPVIHRDLKPSNLIYSNTGKIYLVDFGAVQNTYYDTLMQGSTVVGTYGYMSPEQFRGKALPATDLYSLGATLLYLLSHKSPAELPQDTLKLKFRNYVNISDSFADWLEKILEPDLADRYTNAEVALKELLQDDRITQKKIIINSIATISIFFILLVFNNYKWFLLSRIGYYPDNLCSIKAEKSFLKQGGDINVLGERAKLSFLSCMMKQRKTEDIKQRISEINDFKQIINQLNFEGRTVLHDAAVNQRYEIIDLLLSLGADINRDSNRGTINDGISPLYFTIINNKLGVAQYLIDRGAEVDTKNSHSQHLLFRFLSDSTFNKAKFLINNGIDINLRDRYSRTPLLVLRDSVLKNKLEMMRFLLENGADINAVDNQKNNALFKIYKYNIAKLLIDNDIDINNKNERGENILFRLFVPEIAQLYIDRGIEINQRDDRGRTALFEINNLATVKLLINNGIKINARSNDGSTALFSALSSIWNNELVRLLLENGAEVNVINDKQQTPLSMAVIKQNKEAIELLLKYGADRRYLDFYTIEEIHNPQGQFKQEIKDFLEQNKFQTRN